MLPITHFVMHSDADYSAFTENLAAGTGDFGIDAAIKLWTDEACKFLML